MSGRLVDKRVHRRKLTITTSDKIVPDFYTQILPATAEEKASVVALLERRGALELADMLGVAEVVA